MKNKITLIVKKEVKLNKFLIKKQNLNKKEIEKILNLHKYRLTLELSIKSAEEKYLSDLYKLWLENQRDLQRAWKFKQNDLYIRFWEVPTCSCPKSDNNFMYPRDEYISEKTCKIHKRGIYV